MNRMINDEQVIKTQKKREKKTTDYWIFFFLTLITVLYIFIVYNISRGHTSFLLNLPEKWDTYTDYKRYF